jgi:hypothetical protein
VKAKTVITMSFQLFESSVRANVHVGCSNKDSFDVRVIGKRACIGFRDGYNGSILFTADLNYTV